MIITPANAFAAGVVAEVVILGTNREQSEVSRLQLLLAMAGVMIKALSLDFGLVPKTEAVEVDVLEQESQPHRLAR